MARTMRSFRAAIVIQLWCLVSVGSFTPAFAANIQTLTQAEATLEENKIGCNVALQGEIHEGDLERIQNAFGNLRKIDHFFDSICLTSSGGSFAEGLRIAKYLIQEGIGTVVRSGDQCLSACAIIFMAGTEDIEGFKIPNRKLHPKGILGFHAPYLQMPKQAYDQDDIEAAFRSGVVALSMLLGLEPGPPNEEFFPKDLIVELARHGPKEAYVVETVRDVIRLKIALYGLAEPGQITKRMACNACGNINQMSQFNGCDSENKIQVTRKDQGLEFSVNVPGAEHTKVCVLSVGRVGSAVGVTNGPFYLHVLMPEQSEESQELGLWHLYPPDTPINALATTVAGPKTMMRTR